MAQIGGLIREGDLVERGRNRVYKVFGARNKAPTKTSITEIFADTLDYHSLCNLAISCVVVSLSTINTLMRSATQRERISQAL